MLFSLSCPFFFIFHKNETHNPLKIQARFLQIPLTLFPSSINWRNFYKSNMCFFLITFPTAWFKLMFSDRTALSSLCRLQLSCNFSLLITETIIHRWKYRSFMPTALQRSLLFCYSNRQILSSFSSAFIPAAIIDSTLPWKKIIKKKQIESSFSED